LKAYYKEGTLVSFKGSIGLLKDIDKENDQAEFVPIQTAEKISCSSNATGHCGISTLNFSIRNHATSYPIPTFESS